ncbi:MAG: hypothetical protein JNK60_01930 [Acidobacteria bacterium]|nr:hypothetical protein [Acidobacteriota bacterium]
MPRTARSGARDGPCGSGRSALRTACGSGRSALRTGAALLSLALALGCSGPPATRSTPQELVCIQDRPPETLDPHGGGTISQTQEVLANVYEGVVGLDGQMKVVPALAESWSNPDENTWVLKLRQGARFHTGGVMTAEDVLFSFERARRRAHTALVSLESLEAVPGGVRFRTRAPDASLLGKLRDVFVVSRKFVTEKGEAALASTSAGTGPFSFAAADPSQDVVLHAFDHWGGRPAFSRVRFVTRHLDIPAVEQLARSGLPHFFSLRPSSPASATAAASFDRAVVPGLSVAYLGFDLRGAETPGVALPGSERENPFLVAQVRQAFARSLDLAAVRAAAGAGFIPTQMIPPMVFGHAPEVPAPRQDLEEAKRLLAGTRFAKGFRVRFDYRELMKDLAEPIAESLGALGITVDRNPLPDQAFFEVVGNGQSSLYLLRFSCRYGDAQEFFDRWAHSRDVAAGLGVANYSYERSLVPGLDEAIDGSRREIRPEIRQARLSAISAKLVSEAITVPVYQYEDVVFSTRGLSWTPRIDGYRLLGNATWNAAAAKP